MIKLKSLLPESVDIKWIVGYVDACGKVHYKVVRRNDSIDSHNTIWPGPKHGKWRWIPSDPNHLNTYSEELDGDAEDTIWRIIDRFRD